MFKRNELRAEMVKKGMSCLDLAKAIGIGETTLYRKTIGESDFYRNEIVKIAKALGLSNKRICEIFFA